MALLPVTSLVYRNGFELQYLYTKQGAVYDNVLFSCSTLWNRS